MRYTGHVSARSTAPVVVSAWAGSTNLGDELVLSALLHKLGARGVDAHVLSIDPVGTTTVHGAPASTAARLALGGLGRGARAVVLGGGGLLQDETSPFNLPFHLGRSWAGAAGRPMAGVGLGAGPVSGRLGRSLVRRMMSRTVGTSVRDQGSLDLLGGLGVEAVLAADLAISLPNPRVEVDPRIGVSLRPWVGVQHVLPVALRRSAAAATPAWFLTGMAAALDRVASRTGLGVHFVAMQADRDDAVHHQVAARMRAGATFATPDLEGVVGEVASCEVVVAMRYHAGVAAVLGGRPAVLVGYSPKVPALAGEVPRGLVGTSWDSGALEGLPAAVDAVLGRGEVVVEGRERLRVREAGNDRVIDRLLDAALR